MNAGKRIAIAVLGLGLLLPATAEAAKRPRPSDVPAAQTPIAPFDFQIYNDFASPERIYASSRAVVHYVTLGINAPALNDDDANAVPDYVERVGEAADRSLGYYERRGFRLPPADEAGPDTRPDLYITRFSPGTLGVALPGSRAEGGAFAVVSNNLDPSPERSFASIYATVSHELFHLVQFAYFAPNDEPAIPTWILEGTAAALETRVNLQLDDLVATLQLRPWFAATERSITSQSYGAQLLWRSLDVRQPRFLPALFSRLAERPVTGSGQHAVASTYTRVAGESFAAAFHRFAVSVAVDRADDIKLTSTRSGSLAPLSVRYLRVAVPQRGRSSLTLRANIPATLVTRIDSDIAGEPPRIRRGPRALSFTIPAGPRKSAVLVLSNGGERAVNYVVSAS